MERAISDAVNNIRQDLIDITIQIDLMSKLLVQMSFKQAKLQETLNVLEAQQQLLVKPGSQQQQQHLNLQTPARPCPA